MYTVVRFISRKRKDPNLFLLGEQLNRKRAGMFTRLDKGEASFSSSLAADGDWRQHSKAIAEMAQRCRLLIRRAAKLGIRVSFDTAVEPEDLKNVNLLSLDIDEVLIRSFCSTGAVMEFSCYVMGKKNPRKLKRTAKKGQQK